MDQVDAVVIGAGVMGLAMGKSLAERGLEVIIIEAAASIGTETSSRNSEVIHAGLYYPTGSLKAQACVEGCGQLYTYLASRNVPHRQCGKLIVATDDGELAGLERLYKTGIANGVSGLRMVSSTEVLEMEPSVKCVGALLSKQTGIFDSHGYMLALQGDLENCGGSIAFNSRVVAGAVDSEGATVRVESAEGALELRTRYLVLCAGLHTSKLLAQLDNYPKQHIPPAYFAKGNYFAYSGRNPFSHLIYPAPNTAGLGVHVTFDLGNQIRFGPDVEWVNDLQYTVDPKRSDSFYAAIRKYWPSLPDDSIFPAYSGIRPKIVGPGEQPADFELLGPGLHGLPGLLVFSGIESPGLTSSLPLAKRGLGELGL